MRNDKTPEPRLVTGCPLDRVFKLLSGEWTLHILWTLSANGPTRHGALRRHIGGISAKVLTDRLRMLEAHGLIFREEEDSVPPKVTYGLTPRGKGLDATLAGLHDLAEELMPTP